MVREQVVHATCDKLCEVSQEETRKMQYPSREANNGCDKVQENNAKDAKDVPLTKEARGGQRVAFV